MQDFTAEMMLGMKAENEKLKEEMRVRHMERERNVQEREAAYEQMRKGLEAKMNSYKGKVIALRTENMLLKNDSVKESNPWITPLTGDLARVSYRGKGITMCGVKEADARLASQKLTGKTMNSQRICTNLL